MISATPVIALPAGQLLLTVGCCATSAEAVHPETRVCALPAHYRARDGCRARAGTDRVAVRPNLGGMQTDPGQIEGDATDILPLTSELVDAWTLPWQWEDLSNPMLLLARYFWASLDDEKLDQTCALWHHLVLAVGNFKRQAPIRIALFLPEVDGTSRPSFTPPGRERPLGETDLESWRALERDVRGFGVPTTSTLLSALWPHSHAVIDRFAFRAAVGLRAFAGRYSRGGTVGPENMKPLGDTVTWSDYSEYRRWIIRTSDAIGKEAVLVERTLFHIGRIEDVAGRTWGDYGADILHHALPTTRI